MADFTRQVSAIELGPAQSPLSNARSSSGSHFSLNFGITRVELSGFFEFGKSLRIFAALAVKPGYPDVLPGLRTLGRLLNFGRNRLRFLDEAFA